MLKRSHYQSMVRRVRGQPLSKHPGHHLSQPVGPSHNSSRLGQHPSKSPGHNNLNSNLGKHPSRHRGASTPELELFHPGESRTPLFPVRMDVSTDADQAAATITVVASLHASPLVTSGQPAAGEVRLRWLDRLWFADARVTTSNNNNNNNNNNKLNNKLNNSFLEASTDPSIPLEVADGMMEVHSGEQQVSHLTPASTILRAKESL